jgi:hypothetical protein
MKTALPEPRFNSSRLDHSDRNEQSHFSQYNDAIVQADPQAAGNPAASTNASGAHYRYPDGNVCPELIGVDTWFGADEVADDCPSRRKRMYRRLWRLDMGLDIDPANRELGIEAGHYADETVDVEVVSTHDLYSFHQADACLQQLELPTPVRECALWRIRHTSLKQYNRHGGLSGAIISIGLQTLAEYQNRSSITELKETAWWAHFEDLADILSVRGATGRTFRQLIEYTQEQYRGGAEL